MKKRFERVALIFLTVSMLFISSCKKSDEPNNVIIPGATQSPSASAQQSDEKNGKLILPIPENADRKNPYSITTEEMRTMFSLISEPLIAVDNEGKLTPALAQSWTRAEGKDNEWLLSLRNGVKWHNGENFTAEDVVFSFGALRSYLSTENAATYYSNAVMRVESVTATDDYTVSVSMASRGYGALYGLTFPIVCKSSWQGDTIDGTGAYKVSSENSTSITLTINEGWWRELPHIKTIVFEERLNNETALASYEAGQLNFVPTSNLSAGKYRKEGTTGVIDLMTQDAELLMFNFSNNLLYDMNVRKAIAYSIDRNKLITNVYMNKAQACDVPVAPDSWLYSTKSKTIERNLDQACTMLDNAGYRDTDGDGIREKDGNINRKLSFKLLISESTDNTLRKTAAEAIAAQLLECGIEIKVESKEYSLTQEKSEYIDALRSGDFDLALTGVSVAQNCDLTEFFSRNGSLNFGGYSDDTLLMAANDIMSAEDEVKMRDAAYELQSEFVEKLPFMVLYFRLNSIVYTDELNISGTVREPNIMYGIDSWYMK